MKKSNAYRKAMELMSSLSSKERDSLIREIMSKLGAPAADMNPVETRCDAIVSESHPHRPNCPHCGAKADLGYIVKDGMHKGAQRYKCKACGKKFVSTTGTTFARTRKSAETWYKFIEMTISGKSIAACVEECGICTQTAQTWRHKVMHAFDVNQESMEMTGRVEMDDMFLSVSYKGNHVKGTFGTRRRLPDDENNLPRKSYRRGSDNKSNVQKKACILCMVQNQNQAFFAAVPGIGPANEDMLKATVGKHVKREETRMLSDNGKDNIRFFESNNFEYRAFASNTSDNRHDHKPEVDGDEHIQNVNNFHSRLRKFLRNYCGVSTKYLGNYVAMFAWLGNVKATKQKKSAQKVSVARAATHDCYITQREIANRPAVPRCSAA